MRLGDLAEAVGGRVPSEASNVDVTGVSFDSRAVAAGDLFCCVPGFHLDGHDFAEAARESGAVALLCERPLDVDIPELLVVSVREAMGTVSDLVYGHPSARLDIVGVTGTNGKTTTTFMVCSILEAAGLCAGLTGTVETHVAGEVEPVRHTTPEAPELHALLRRMADAGVEAVAMEVSSHALDQGRVGAVRFRVGAFTNLSQDHLDYHADMEEYFTAKAKLFDPSCCSQAVLNVDDEHGLRLVEHCRRVGLPFVTFGVGDSDADVALFVTAAEADSLRVELRGPFGTRAFTLGIGGAFNAQNAACAAACALALGIDADALTKGLERMPPVPGRFEPVMVGQPFGVLVDYAHTPAGIENVLQAGRSVLTGGRLICVLGCGGDRDRAKRPLMGRAAAQLADYVIVTSDNPRSEEPLAIVEDILRGLQGEQARHSTELDRRGAIRLAFESARPGDLVVIAGKGHERGQEVMGVVRPFDDRFVAREELVRLGWDDTGGFA